MFSPVDTFVKVFFDAGIVFRPSVLMGSIEQCVHCLPHVSVCASLITQEEVRKGVRSLLDVKNATFVIYRNTLKMTFSSFFINLDSLFVVFLIIASPWSPMWGRDMNTGHEYRSTDRYNSSCSWKYSPTDMHIFGLSFILFYLNISDSTGYRGGTGSTEYRSFL